MLLNVPIGAEQDRRADDPRHQHGQGQHDQDPRGNCLRHQRNRSRSQNTAGLRARRKERARAPRSRQSRPVALPRGDALSERPHERAHHDHVDQYAKGHTSEKNEPHRASEKKGPGERFVLILAVQPQRVLAAAGGSARRPAPYKGNRGNRAQGSVTRRFQQGTRVALPTCWE